MWEGKPMGREEDEVLARITPSPLRRGMATAMVGLLGSLLLIVAAQRPPEAPGFLVFLLAFGLGAMWLAWTLWQSSAATLELTMHELREAGPSGRQLCALDAVERIDRGFFAFKPANGFLVRLKQPRTRIYAPGLWWRAGRWLAVGGVTSKSEAKAMAEVMSVLIAQRDGDAP